MDDDSSNSLGHTAALNGYRPQQNKDSHKGTSARASETAAQVVESIALGLMQKRLKKVMLISEDDAELTEFYNLWVELQGSQLEHHLPDLPSAGKRAAKNKFTDLSRKKDPSGKWIYILTGTDDEHDLATPEVVSAEERRNQMIHELFNFLNRRW